MSKESPATCPVCRSRIEPGAHICLQCKSVLSPPKIWLFYVGVFSGLALPATLALISYFFDLRKEEDNRREQDSTVLIREAEDLATLGKLAESYFIARYNLNEACNPHRDVASSEAHGMCGPALLDAVLGLDKEMIALAYRLESALVTPETRLRFESLNANYWAQPSGYRQEILQALHANGQFKDELALTSCGPAALGTPNTTRCASTIAKLKSVVGTPIQVQADAVFCSVLRDARTLRKSAFKSSLETAGNKGTYKLLFDRLEQTEKLTTSCSQKLTKTAVDYKP